MFLAAMLTENPRGMFAVMPISIGTAKPAIIGVPARNESNGFVPSSELEFEKSPRNVPAPIELVYAR